MGGGGGWKIEGVCVSWGGGGPVQKNVWGGGGFGGGLRDGTAKNMYKMENHEYFNIMGRMEGSSFYISNIEVRYICKVGSRKEVGQT